MRLLLYTFSVIFNTIITIRNWLFDYNLFPSNSHPIPIICIGNLSIGGSGKTPHTNYIIDLLKKANVTLAARYVGKVIKTTSMFFLRISL